uniref:Aa_trans domain-containing protein n=1 Tax=Rhodnius prolixus TaxID=13249 RepID=T1HU60_RHOPR
MNIGITKYESTGSSSFACLSGEFVPPTTDKNKFQDVPKNVGCGITKHGLSAISAAVFIVGEMAGSGILALPRAIVDSGWIGLILLTVLCLTSGYGGTRLGLCWEILEERYPEYRGISRNPYPTIASRAVGRWGSILVSACIQITLFGAGVVYLLLASQNVQDLLKPLLPRVTFCTWFIIFAILITGPMWLGSPKDFWIVGVGAVMTTVLACVFIFIQMIFDGINSRAIVHHNPKSFNDFFLSFGIILFSFGGASTFPTIQNDMIDRGKFKRSVYIGFAVILLLYLPLTVSGYIVYGDRMNANIILSLGRSIFVVLANISMASHLILAFLIVVNPVCQELENIFDIPHEFCVLRCVIRTCMVLVMVIIGESMPHFDKLLALVGGSTVSLLTFVLPNLFYMKLCDQESPGWKKRKIPLHMRVFMWELIIIGLIGGIAATYSAFLSIINSFNFSKSCFL